MSSINSDMVAEMVPQPDESSNKRKRDLEDHGDRDQKKVHVEDDRLTIDDLHLDVGEKYLLCRTPHPVVRPHPSQDLFELYSLTGIAASVARVLPGAVKNSLRKTYKGYIKNSGISGQFDAVKKELGAPDTLFEMMRQPEEEWVVEYVQGKEVEKGLPEPAVAGLGKAMTMARGVVPKELWDNAVLGELVAVPQTTSPAKAVQGGARMPAAPTASASRTGKADVPRPKRNVKKRTYGDSSFEGYGEGFVDDELQDAGYSTGEGDDRAGGRKRSKKTPVTHSFQGPMRQNSYGPGMVGV